jgi:hypothetical protein
LTAQLPGRHHWHREGKYAQVNGTIHGFLIAFLFSIVIVAHESATRRKFWGME